MPPIKHNDEHPTRPEWWNGISLGNVITIGGGIFAIGVFYATVNSALAEQAAKVQDADQRHKEAVADIKEDVRRLESKIDALLMAVREQK